MSWNQVYDPLGHWGGSSLAASLSLLVLLGLLAGFKARSHVAATAEASVAVLCAIVALAMPATLEPIRFAYAAAFGPLKVAWIIIAAIYLYELSVDNDQLEILKRSIAVPLPRRYRWRRRSHLCLSGHTMDSSQPKLRALTGGVPTGKGHLPGRRLNLHG